jgi:hypothetical protein
MKRREFFRVLGAAMAAPLLSLVPKIEEPPVKLNGIQLQYLDRLDRDYSRTVYCANRFISKANWAVLEGQYYERS